MRLRAHIVAVALLLGQAAGLVHLAAVRHERCLEHGEVIDRHGPPTPDRHVVEPEVSPVSAVGGGPAEHAHEHCPVALQRRESFSLRHDAHTLELPPQAHAWSVARPVAGPPPLTPYRLAPKNSPPA